MDKKGHIEENNWDDEWGDDYYFEPDENEEDFEFDEDWEL